MEMYSGCEGGHPQSIVYTTLSSDFISFYDFNLHQLETNFLSFPPISRSEIVETKSAGTLHLLFRQTK